MPQLIVAIIRFVALLAGVLFAYLGIESPLNKWADEATIRELHKDAQQEYEKILDSQSDAATTTEVLDAIKPNTDVTILEDVVGTSSNLIPTPTAPVYVETPVSVEIPTTEPKEPITPEPVLPEIPVEQLEESSVHEQLPEPEPEESDRPSSFEEFLSSGVEKKIDDDLHDPHSAVMRISCTKAHGPATELLSGSGVIISPDGYMITNAHVGYFFTDDNYDCIVTEAAHTFIGYKGVISFISDSWLENFEDDVHNGSLPASTGEHDIAIVKLTTTLNPAILIPDQFPHIEVSKCTARKGDDVSTWGYPGTRSGNILDDIRNSIVKDETSVRGTYSFDGGDVDVIETGRTDTAQQGSSGGAILFNDGTLAGVIATMLDRDGNKVLTGLSGDYITRLLSEENSKLSKFAAFSECN